ncbi:Uncharacterized protein cmbei_1001180 [Cryptosporidium meleagridis]
MCFPGYKKKWGDGEGNARSEFYPENISFEKKFSACISSPILAFSMWKKLF